MRRMKVIVVDHVNSVASHPGPHPGKVITISRKLLTVNKAFPKGLVRKIRKSVTHHEGKECVLMARGLPYSTAHRRATRSERNKYWKNDTKGWRKYSNRVYNMPTTRSGKRKVHRRRKVWRRSELN